MVLHMEKRLGHKSQIGKARHFLHCVILEQRAATEELKASNRELEGLLEEILSSRNDLRTVAKDDVAEESNGLPARMDPEGRVADLKREVEAVLEQGATVIKESVRLRKRSQRIRQALQGPSKPAPVGQGLSKREHQV